MATLAPSLRRLFSEIDGSWPNRDRRTDGWYRAPSAGKSVGHNPGARGLVHAIDVDRDGIDPSWIINHIARSGAMYYIIWDRRVWSTKTGWDGHRYTGSNPHTDHMHIEIYQTTSAENFAGGWGIGVTQGIGVAGGTGTSSGMGGSVSQGISAVDPRNAQDAIITSGNLFGVLAAAMWGHTGTMNDLNRL